jgi:hypothetical protein
MKPLLLIPILAAPLLLSACETVVVDRPVRRSAYVERDVVYRDSHAYRGDRDYREYRDYRRDDDDRDDRYDRDDRRKTNVVVVQPSTPYRPQASVRYQTDSRGRYYVRDGRRVYSNAGVVRY